MFQIPTKDSMLVWNQTKKYYSSHPEHRSILLKELPLEEYQNFPRTYETEITFNQDDCIDVAIYYKTIKGLNPLVLNMCDWDVAGGLVGLGAHTQEEECFRRSNYFKHLRTDDFYPLEAIDTILSRNVEYSRHGSKMGYISMNTPVYLDMVAAPALEFPRINPETNQMCDPEEIKLFEDKIRMLFYTGMKNGNDCLVLSAWGCGAFGCPAYHVGHLFRTITNECAGMFKQITFAILGNPFQDFHEGFVQDEDDFNYEIMEQGDINTSDDSGFDVSSLFGTNTTIVQVEKLS
jgi:uncharacterized protein (TIGR02452 family)